MIIENNLRKKMQAGIPVIGTWNTLTSPLATEAMAQAGFDFQIIDLEHGPFKLDQVHLQVSACELSGACAPLVRIPANQNWMALQALDQGAHGLVVPHINDVSDATKLVSSIKYFPRGARGFSPYTKGGGFSNNEASNYAMLSNKHSLCVAIIESLEGINNVEEIASTDGLDVIYFGAYDLSQALGHPGNPRHPSVVEAIKKAASKVKSAGKFAGGFVPQSKDEIKWVLDMGLLFVTYDVDSSILYRHVRDLKDWLNIQVK